MTLVTPKREDVPTAARGRGAANPAERRVADMLRKHHGKSYRVFEYDDVKSASSVAQSIRRGQRAAFQEGFTAASRTVDGKGVVYVTYVGDTK